LTTHLTIFFQDVGLWLEEINLGSYRQVFEENGVNGEYLESLSMFTTEQRFCALIYLAVPYEMGRLYHTVQRVEAH